MTDILFKYPLDLLGTSVNNKVVGEAHTIGTMRRRLFAPDYGPFFGNSVSIRDAVTGVVLTGDQFILVHYYKEAVLRTGQAVYAAIAITDPTVGTDLLVSVQYVGGEFSYSFYAIQQAIALLANDTRPVAWGDLIGVPAEFNPAPHTHSIYQTYGWEREVWASNDIAAAIREGDTASRNMLVGQITDKLSSFGNTLTTALATVFHELSYIKVTADTVLEAKRRYLILGDFTVTTPLLTGDLVHGDWIILSKLLSANPVILSTDQSIFCVNGTDAAHAGILFNHSGEQKLVWNGPMLRWEI